MKKFILLFICIQIASFAFAYDSTFVTSSFDSSSNDDVFSNTQSFEKKVYAVSSELQNEFYERFMISEEKEIESFDDLKNCLDLTKSIGTYAKTLFERYREEKNNIESFFNSKEEKETENIKNRAYSNSELDDFTGKPSAIAEKIRQEEIDDLIKKYDNQKNEDLKKIDNLYRPLIQKAFDLYLQNVQQIEKCNLLLSNSNGLLRIDSISYDGEESKWQITIANSLGFDKFFRVEVPFKDLTGTSPANSKSNDNEVELYNQIAKEYSKRLVDFDNNYKMSFAMRVLTDVDAGSYHFYMKPEFSILDYATGKTIKLNAIERTTEEKSLSELVLRDFQNESWLKEKVKVSSEARRAKKSEVSKKHFKNFFDGIFWDFSLVYKTNSITDSLGNQAENYGKIADVGLTGSIFSRISDSFAIGIEVGAIYNSEKMIEPCVYLDVSYDYTKEHYSPMYMLSAGYASGSFDIWAGIKTFYVLGIGYKADSGVYFSVGFDLSKGFLKNYEY